MGTVRQIVKGTAMKRPALVTLVLAALSTPALAVVIVRDPWVHATASQQKSTVAFMQLTSSIDARLVKADSPVAKAVEFHEMVMNNYVMKINAVPALDLPAGKAVEFKPDGYMVILSGLKQQIKEGDTVPISIVIEGKNKQCETIALNVIAMTMDTVAADKHAHTQMQEREHMA
jgi:copper(I)-binding protein